MQNTTNPHKTPQPPTKYNYNQKFGSKNLKPGDYIIISTPRTTLMGRVWAIALGCTKIKSIYGNMITIPDSMLSKSTIVHLSGQKHSKPPECTVKKSSVVQAV